MGIARYALLVAVSLTGGLAGNAIAAPQGVYVQVLGGIAAPLDVNFNPGAEATLTGGAFAGTVGVVVMPGLAVEADVLFTTRAYPASGLDGSNTTTSLMGNAKFIMPVSTGFDIYGAAGVGVIRMVTTEGGTTYPYDPALGYQLILGADAAVADNLSIVGEVRFQNSFSPYTDTGLGFNDELSVPTVTALFGLKAGF